MAQMHNSRSNTTGYIRTLVILLQKGVLLLARYWFLAATLLALVILTLGFLAPAFMSMGRPGAGQAMYRFLAPHNHQLPQRSYFLFGQQAAITTYSLEEIIGFGADPQNLQAFVGNPEIGFKTALNHRMIAIFVAILLGGLGWGLAGERPRLGFVELLLLSLPLLIDGFSHMLSESSGLAFRDTNQWAVWLTGGLFSPEFYRGSTAGTLNWLLRTLTGLLFGLGLVWFLYTYLSDKFWAIRTKLEARYKTGK
jgi:uncharacterized membrane protein